MFKLFGDRTIKKAVTKILAERIADAQDEYDMTVFDLDIILEQEIEEAKKRNKEQKEAQARQLADKVLGK